MPISKLQQLSCCCCYDRVGGGGGGGHSSSKWSFKRLVALILAVFFVYVAVSAALSQHWQIQATSHEATFVPEVDADGHHHSDGKDKGEGTGTGISAAWSLLEKTRRAVQVAGGVPGTTLSDEDRQQWESVCPCHGRDQLRSLWLTRKEGSTKRAPREPSGELHLLFQEYSNLHRTCTRGGNMTHVLELYEQRANRYDCKFLVVEFGVYGVGNRLLWLASAYLYALLTQRVLLIDTRDTIHQLLCDPFPGSSWELQPHFPFSSAQRWPMPDAFFQVWDAWERDERSYKAYMAEMARKNGTEERRADDDDDASTGRSTTKRRSLLLSGPTIFDRAQANDGWSPNPRFFCDKDQQRLQQVQWMSLNSGCLYFLPDLFAMASFRPALEALFPDRDPLTHLLRQIALPVDSVWNRVFSVHRAHFQSSRKVVGLQVRFRDGGGMYRALNDMVNERITACGREHDIILNPAAGGGSRDEPPLVIFIASLHTGLQRHLREFYADLLERQMLTGKATLKLLQLSHAGFQAFDLDGDFQAFAEVVILSLSDEILTSPMSTFGYIAQAYGGLRPWLIDFDLHSSTSCRRGQSSDACYQMALSSFACPADPDINGKRLQDVVPYLRPCQDTDGLQLVPTSDM
ncbi:xyloglucan fucosyltransferase [Marchantia polymorpha subsp. ruderalis]|uniref:Fucosyltransferase n=1 Tax=Marchantia polymorpha TaxID=3197 RepID=A0A2R6X2W7_MARPO|nr:hypothetical protein MARPO_0040s0103 [Marchantia polymorpha]BBN03144.1 hypothetical protein Mp_2g21110 [Marchantia polymorpha subsp. ruderalis]|eukprot:PTQ40432.1 hypothetical protein MARPO_0040s0103 [Marchantia polymorpha]